MSSCKCVVCGDIFNCDIIQPISVCPKCREKSLKAAAIHTEMTYELLHQSYQDGYENGVRDFAKRLHDHFDVECEKTHGGIDFLLKDMLGQ